MEKTIKIGKESVRINNGMAWALYYNDQFGEDITTAFIPLAASIMKNLEQLMDLKEKKDGGDEITITDIAHALGTDEAIDALFGLSAFGMTGFIKIFWALAKCADDETPPPMEWAKRFNSCPVDTVARDVILFALNGYISSKNWRRLGDMMTTQPEESQ